MILITKQDYRERERERERLQYKCVVAIYDYSSYSLIGKGVVWSSCQYVSIVTGGEYLIDCDY